MTTILTPQEYETRREFTAEQVAEAAQQALDNWDWDVVEFHGEEQQEALKHLVKHAEDLELDASTDIWDWLSEYAESTAMNIAVSRQ